jgi:RNA polymerase sigma-70 factor (ECF subfamily)
MLFQVSRLGARTDAHGRLLTLAEQERSLWDHGAIAAGLRHLAESAEGNALTDYHLEAGIAACHAVAPSFDETDWRRIVGYYDRLLELNDSPIIRLNRAIAVGRAGEPDRALRELRALEKDPRLSGYGLLGAAQADALALIGDVKKARAMYERALAQALTEPERELLRRRLSELA